ncbi:hypothetical protein IFU01_18195 [Oxalobacteraceae sp. CFBP 8763]|nr:hypothetical protein [Oxalobacteraceae sp. CFBP 8763]
MKVLNITGMSTVIDYQMNNHEGAAYTHVTQVGKDLVAYASGQRLLSSLVTLTFNCACAGTSEMTPAALC